MPNLNMKSLCSVGTDEYFHLYYIDLIKKNNNKLPKKNSLAYGGPNFCTYPSLFHILLSYFPREQILKGKTYFSIILDLCSISVFSYILLTQFNVGLDKVCLLICFYLLNPSFIFFAPGPRSFSITPRAFAQTFFLIGFSVLLIYLFNHDPFLLQLSVFIFAISVLSSKFTVQVVFFVSIVMSVLTMSYDPIVYMLNICFWCLLLGKRNFVSQMIGQIKHSQWYFYNGYKFIDQKWQWYDLYSFLKNINLRDAWQIIIFNNPLTRVILLNLPVLCYIVLISHNDLSEPQLLVLNFIYASMIVSFLSNFSIFRIFGEPERYIEYAIGGVLFLLATNAHNSVIYFSLVHAFIFILYSRRVELANKSINTSHDVQQLQKHLAKSKNIRTICTANNETYIFCETNVEVVLGFFSNNIHSVFNKYFYSVYPNVHHTNFSEIIKEFCVRRIIINKNKKESTLYNVNDYFKVFENTSYVVYEVPHA